ncbi:Prolipoprotein diacylglyceryl transferase [Dermatophilus congolensis]|uniref:Phosphatidylglycerol--prolipoprotein diacylglyceryl transferase n=2 Tax=Dermatophilus congolensis TaxID=1863 RepID=A0AA46BN54_9MICO|nr:Prolipoprotein diacylglyceryl transferase [Dermatophilus congolensis]
MLMSIPSPEQAVWFLGPVPIRAYALCILLGVVIAAWWTSKRLAARGEDSDAMWDITMWAVVFGIIGGRIYHVFSTPAPYWGPNGNPWNAFKVWEGGLGIWGAVALGAVGVWLGCRQTKVSFLAVAESVAPALPLAQAIGRFGNWFNNELYGAATDLPWGLQIHAWDFAAGRAQVGPDGHAVIVGTFHPTFLYEALWCAALSLVLVGIEKARRGRGGPGQLFAAYIMGYTLGRVWIEYLRIDTAEIVFGLRLNVWTSIIVFVFGAVLWWMLGRRHRTTSQTDNSGKEISSEEKPAQ